MVTTYHGGREERASYHLQGRVHPKGLDRLVHIFDEHGVLEGTQTPRGDGISRSGLRVALVEESHDLRPCDSPGFRCRGGPRGQYLVFLEEAHQWCGVEPNGKMNL